MAYLYQGSIVPADDNDGVPYTGALLYFYLSGTTTETPTYTDEDGLTEHPHPVMADSAGRFPPIFLNPNISYRAKCTNFSGSDTVYDVDPIDPPLPDSLVTQAELSGTGGAGMVGIVGGGTVQDAIDGAASPLFSSLAGTPPVIPMSQESFNTSGWDEVGLGAANYIFSGTVDAVYVAAHPRIAFLDAEGRGWVLNPNQYLTIEMFGGKGDDNGTTGTDNLPAVLEAVAYANVATYISPFAAFWDHARRIHYGKGRYYHGGTFEPHVHFDLHGEASGDYHSGSRAGTVWVIPSNTVGVRVHGTSTDGNGVPASPPLADAAGSIFKGFQIESRGGSDLTKHGFQMRVYANLIDCSFINIPGNAIEITAFSGSGTPSLEGNANDWRVMNCSVYSCGGHALHVRGNDANAGVCLGFKTFNAGLCGIFDESALGSNSYISPQITGYADSNVGSVSHGGRNYTLIDQTAGIGASTTPGTNNAIWYDIGTSGTFPAWSGAGSYTVSCPILAVGDSNRSVFVAPYVEGGGIAHIQGPSITIGGQSGFTRYSPSLHRVLGITTAVYSNTGTGGSKGYSPAHAELGDSFEASVGIGDGVILNHTVGSESGSWQLRYTLGDIVYQQGGFGVQPFGITSTNTTKTFGRTSPVPKMFFVSGLAIGDENGAGSARYVCYGDSAPASGYHARGEIVFNRAPSASGTIGWTCTTAGTPGTWKTFGAISA